MPTNDGTHPEQEPTIEELRRDLDEAIVFDDNVATSGAQSGAADAEFLRSTYPELDGLDIPGVVEDLAYDPYAAAAESEVQVTPEAEVHPEAVPAWVQQAVESKKADKPTADQPTKPQGPRVVADSEKAAKLSRKDEAAIRDATFRILAERRRAGISGDDYDEDGLNF